MCLSSALPARAFKGELCDLVVIEVVVISKSYKNSKEFVSDPPNVARSSGMRRNRVLTAVGLGCLLRMGHKGASCLLTLCPHLHLTHISIIRQKSAPRDMLWYPNAGACALIDMRSCRPYTNSLIFPTHFLFFFQGSCSFS